MTSILDLKNKDNHRTQKNHFLSDIVNGDDLISKEPEPIPIIPNEVQLRKSRKEEKPTQPTLLVNKIDKIDEFPDNLWAMDEEVPLNSILLPLSWSAPGVHHELISHSWRKATIIGLVGLAFLALFWQQSILTALTFLILAVITSIHFWREHQPENYEIHSHGLVVGDRFHHYHDLDSFCIHYLPGGLSELSLRTGKLLNHYIKIPLGSQDPFEIRDALMLYLPEESHEEGFDDWLRRKLGL